MKKYLKLGVLLAALVCIMQIHPTFAADAAPVTTGALTQLFNTLLKFLSWGWMLMAFLAGKLMSNDFIYGTFIHLDSALFKLWNYMKNIANFMLGFLFLFGILKTFFTKDAFELKNVLPRYLVAGVLIQMSRFIMGAFVDLSNIATAAVGAFPAQFIQGSVGELSSSKMMQMAVSVPSQVDVSFKDGQPLFTTHTGTQTIDSMFARFNDMSGPLLFIGTSIFRFQDYDIVNADISSLKNFSIGLFIKLLLIIGFTVPLFVLIVVNLIRIFRLWIWIAFSPLAAIARSFDDKSMPGVVKSTGEKLGFGKLSDVLSLIFQPVAMIGALSLVMILSIGLYYVLGGDPGNQLAGTTYSKTIEQISLEAKGDISTLKDNVSNTEINVDGNLFKGVGSFVGGMIGYLILTGFCVVLIRTLIKISSSFSKFTKGASDNIFKWSEKLVSNANIIPLGTGTSFAALKETKNEAMRSIETAGYASKKVDDQTNKLTSAFFKTGIGGATKKTFGIPEALNSDITKGEQNDLRRGELGSVDQVLGNIRKILNEKNVSAQSSNFNQSFNELMSKNATFKDFMIKGAGITAEEYEKNKKNILDTNSEPGKKMLNFLAYALNKPDIKEGATINENDMKEFLTKNFNTSSVLSSTPLMTQKQE